MLCCLQVDEVGSSAAAATAVTMTRARPMTIIFDRPFMFLIHVRRDNDHLGPDSDMATGRGTVLFMGRITNPGTTIMSRPHQDFPVQDDSGNNGGGGDGNGGDGNSGDGDGGDGDGGGGNGGGGDGGDGDGGNSNGGGGDGGNGEGGDGEGGFGYGGNGYGGNGNSGYGNGGYGYKSGCGAMFMNVFAMVVLVFISMTSASLL